jgi:hypothetical protein
MSFQRLLSTYRSHDPAESDVTIASNTSVTKKFMPMISDSRKIL